MRGMKTEGKKIAIRIDGRAIKALEGEYLLDVARREGIEIPSLCRVEGLKPGASCRLCLVEVELGGARRVATSCNYPVMPGMKVLLDTPEVLEQRSSVFEALLAQAPGSARLREYAARWGVSGTTLKVQEGECILCGLCVGVCEEVVGAHAITFSGRGKDRRVSLLFGEQDLDACTGCGACGFVCPTSCIDMERQKLRILARQWRPGGRVCRYSLLGLLPGAVCDNDYDCASCSLDRRMFELAQGRHPAFLLRRGGDE